MKRFLLVAFVFFFVAPAAFAACTAPGNCESYFSLIAIPDTQNFRGHGFKDAHPGPIATTDFVQGIDATKEMMKYIVDTRDKFHTAAVLGLGDIVDRSCMGEFICFDKTNQTDCESYTTQGGCTWDGSSCAPKTCSDSTDDRQQNISDAWDILKTANSYRNAEGPGIPHLIPPGNHDCDRGSLKAVCSTGAAYASGGGGLPGNWCSSDYGSGLAGACGTLVLSDATCDLDGTITVTMDNTSSVKVGMSVIGTGIPSGANVASVEDGTTFTMDIAAEISANNRTLEFGAYCLKEETSTGCNATPTVGGRGNGADMPGSSAFESFTRKFSSSRYVNSSTGSDYTWFQEQFGPARPSFWGYFTADGIRMIQIALEYGYAQSPDVPTPSSGPNEGKALMEWVEDIIDDNPGVPVVIHMHAFLEQGRNAGCTDFKANGKNEGGDGEGTVPYGMYTEQHVAGATTAAHSVEETRGMHEFAGQNSDDYLSRLHCNFMEADHDITNSGGTPQTYWDSDPRRDTILWDTIKDEDQVWLLINGHYTAGTGTFFRTEANDSGKPVIQVFENYQKYWNKNPPGWLFRLEIDRVNDVARGIHYSPHRGIRWDRYSEEYGTKNVVVPRSGETGSKAYSLDYANWVMDFDIDAITTECNDGKDNDRDGYFDYPDDDSCADYAGASES